MMEIGRVCLKTAGRDSNKKCVIVDTLENNYVVVDGETRRKKVNVKHLEPLSQTLSIKKGASHEEVASEFKKLGVEVRDIQPKAEKPAKQEKKSEDKAPEKKAKEQPKEKKAAKKAKE